MATPKPSLLSAFLFAAGPISWPFFERYAQQRFDAGQLPSYDMKIESLSDLGVDYRQVHPLKHHNVHSYAHPAINFAFFITAACYGLGHLDLIWTSRRTATSQTARLRTIRVFLSLLTAAGFVLMGTIHGGPREKFWGIIGWHWMGFGLAAFAGNLIAVLSAMFPGVGAYEGFVLYRLYSLGLGIAGLYSYYRFNTIGEWDFESPLGLWQRGSVYPVLVWQVLTAMTLVYDNVKSDGKGKKA